MPRQTLSAHWICHAKMKQKKRNIGTPFISDSDPPHWWTCSPLPWLFHFEKKNSRLFVALSLMTWQIWTDFHLNFYRLKLKHSAQKTSHIVVILVHFNLPLCPEHYFVASLKFYKSWVEFNFVLILFIFFLIGYTLFILNKKN